MIKKTPLPIYQCNSSIHYLNHAELFKNFTLWDGYLCLNCLSEVQVELYGGINFDVQKFLGFRYIEFNLIHCRNSTTKNDCYPDSKITELLNDITVDVISVDYKIDNLNITNPTSSKLVHYSYEFSSVVYKAFSESTNIVKYISDFGFVFSQKEEANNFQQSRAIESINVLGANQNNTLIGEIAMVYSGYFEVYNRSFTKLQTVIANVGGIIKAILIISKMIDWAINRNEILLILINKSFKFNDKIENASISTNKIELNPINNYLEKNKISLK